MRPTATWLGIEGKGRRSIAKKVLATAFDRNRTARYIWLFAQRPLASAGRVRGGQGLRRRATPGGLPNRRVFFPQQPLSTPAGGELAFGWACPIRWHVRRSIFDNLVICNSGILKGTTWGSLLGSPEWFTRDDRVPLRVARFGSRFGPAQAVLDLGSCRGVWRVRERSTIS
jgi:hypothetical protein